MDQVLQDYILIHLKGGSKMITIANYLYAAVSSGIYTKKDWQSWADKQILNKDNVEDWIYNVSLAPDVDNLCKVIYDKMIDENYYKYNEFSITDAVIGYYYELYLENKLSLYDLIEKSAQASDSSGQCTIDCEYFYSILNELDSNITLMQDDSFIYKISELFKPFKDIADKQKITLENY
jgi:hypothetical protein